MNRSPSQPLNILVMHSDPLLCAGLIAALRQQPGFEIFVHGVDNLSSTEPRIDVVIAEHQDALRLTDRAARGAHGPLGEARILALTANAREADVRRALEAGVHGYVLLGGSLDELAEGVRIVGSGVRYLSRAVAQRMADSLTHNSLTMREIEVLRLVTTGQSNKAIANRLAIEVGTVKTHVKAIMTKLGAISRTQAANIAAARGLVEWGEPAPRASAWRPSSVGAQSQYA